MEDEAWAGDDSGVGGFVSAYREQAETESDYVAPRGVRFLRWLKKSVVAHLLAFAAVFMGLMCSIDLAVELKRPGFGFGCGLLALGVVIGVIGRCFREWG